MTKDPAIEAGQLSGALLVLVSEQFDLIDELAAARKAGRRSQITFTILQAIRSDLELLPAPLKEQYFTKLQELSEIRSQLTCCDEEPPAEPAARKSLELIAEVFQRLQAA